MFRCHDSIPCYTTQPIVINFCLSLSFPLNLPLSPLLILILFQSSLRPPASHVFIWTPSLVHYHCLLMAPSPMSFPHNLKIHHALHHLILATFNLSILLPFLIMTSIIVLLPLQYALITNQILNTLPSPNLNCTPNISEICLPQSLTMFSTLTNSHKSQPPTLGFPTCWNKRPHEP